MLKDYFIEVTKKAILKAIENHDLGMCDKLDVELICDPTKNKEFGDFAINVSSLARFCKIAPPLIAQNIAKYIEVQNFSVNLISYPQ